jgi:Domain of unknown function (DUF5666)/Repeat of unknown function (DUF5648)
MRKSILFSAVMLAVSSTGHAVAATSPPDMTVVEYFHRGADRYFMTGRQNEQELLDDSRIGHGLLRTGRSFSAWSPNAANPPANLAVVTRFYIPSVSSHFYTARADEKSLLRSMPDTFVDEGTQFLIQTADDSRCATGTKPIFRSFNKRSDGNHRFSNEIEVHATMVSRGFADEKTAFCAATIATDNAAESRSGTPGDASEDIKVSGAVSGFVSVSNFMVGAQRVDASNARFEHAAAASLANGMSVTVEGVVINNVLVATEVKLPELSEGIVDEIKGFVTALGSLGRFFLNGVSIDASNAAVIGGRLVDLVVGQEVEVHGNFVAGTFVATAVEIEDRFTGVPTAPQPPIAGAAELNGSVSGFVSVANFTVNGQKVDATNAVFRDGSPASLRNGVTVEVKGNIVNGVLIATRVEIKSSVSVPPAPQPPSPPAPSPSPGVEWEARANVADFVSISSFTLNGTKIDASAASFERGTAADLRNGVLVEVKGRLANGVVKATRVRFER